MTTLSNIDTIMKDMFPAAGTRIKKWVVEQRREREWVLATCPTVVVSEHDDNTGVSCRNVGAPIWLDLDHDCCSTCGVVCLATKDRADVTAWIAEFKARPRPVIDKDELSDEIAPDISLRPHPFISRMPK